MTDLPAGPKPVRVAVLAGTITLYDPDPEGERSPATPDVPTVALIEQAVENAVAELGYAVNAKFSRSDK